jgi:hypothetical protein
VNTLPADWYERSPYVDHALADEPWGMPPVEYLAEMVTGLFDDRRGSLNRLNREDIVHALDHIRSLVAE